MKIRNNTRIVRYFEMGFIPSEIADMEHYNRITIRDTLSSYYRKKPTAMRREACKHRKNVIEMLIKIMGLSGFPQASIDLFENALKRNTDADFLSMLRDYYAELLRRTEQ